MASSSLLFVTLCVLLCHVHAHNWLLSPMARQGAEANTVSPCEAIVASTVTTPVFKGQGLLVTWTDNHQDNNIHAVGIAPYGSDKAVSSFAQLYSVPSGTASHELPASTFSSYAVGNNYTLRYSWATWDNCAQLRIAAPPPASTYPPASVNITVNPVTKQPLQSGDYIIMDQNTPAGVFNVYNVQTTCATGYKKHDTTCVSSSSSGSGSGGGMSAGGKAALSIFIIFIVCIAAFCAFSYYKTGNALNLGRALIVRIKGGSSSSSSSSSSVPPPVPPRKAANYAAYVDNGAQPL